MTSPQPSADPAGSPAPKPRLTQSQAKRAGQSSRAMVLSVLATLAIALVVVLLNPVNAERDYESTVDVAATAEQATATAGFTAVAPAVPEGWSANYARWNAAGTDQVEFWEAGYLTAEEDFAGFKQTAQSNPTWLSQQMDNAPATGTRSVDGTRWDLYEPADGDRHLVAEVGGTTVLVSGSGDLEDLDILASAIQQDLKEG
ncbi:DUF4245 domain-containing protein [Citricoccus sp. I39-566]|uniref:DUF4245 domain-containing protein n=1 Tax=Citricoccus sp. I39-566 TaxID=3073268 RepID=UPI00286B3242|nr:DUF4245 domain-containing protein [Citricoccus sp. I39-566]WMY79612.1 DUF4245 domain-containing protein [Citricoccus sp. I39-566]